MQSAVASDTPDAQSGGVNETPTPELHHDVLAPDEKSIDWHTPDGAAGYSWVELQQLSQSLALSSLVPPAFRRQPNNVVAIALTGQELGWGVATAMRFIQVIDGKPTVSPEGMLALVRRAGHSVRGSSSSRHATVYGKRRDNGDDMEITFTWADAERAKLTGKNNWITFPEAMLWARALAMLCRRLFSDVLLGTAYVPDEMGVETNEKGEWIPANSTDVTGQTGGNNAPPTVDWEALKWDKGVAQFDAAMRDTKRLLNMLPQDAQAKVRELCGPPPPTTEYSLNVWARRHKIVVDAARELGIEAAFKDTTPDMTAMQDDATPTVIPDAEPPATIAAAAATIADTDVEDLTPPAPPAREYTPAEDAADDEWVRQALGEQGPVDPVGDAEPDEPIS